MVVGFLEELKARGFNNFIVLGSCGVLDQSIQADKIIIPSSALRDEGTSTTMLQQVMRFLMMKRFSQL